MRNKRIDITDQPGQTRACCLFIRFMNEVKEYTLNDSEDCRNPNGPDKWNKFSLNSLCFAGSSPLIPFKAKSSLSFIRKRSKPPESCQVIAE